MKNDIQQKQPPMMDVLLVKPNMYPQQVQIGCELEDLQKAVGGDIEAVYPFDEPVALVVNEEGKLNGSELNRALRDSDGNVYDIVAGDFLVVGLGDEDFISLPPEQMKKFEEHFHQPEMFVRKGNGIAVLPLSDDMVKKTDVPTDITTKIKPWYTATFPTDDLGNKLNPEVTFQNVYTGLKRGQSPYSVLGIFGDSVIRERVFEQLRQILKVPYMDIYTLWLDGPQVAALRSGEQKPRLVSFSDLRKGDLFYINGEPVQVGVASHYSDDASYDGYLLYDTNGEPWYPEDLDETLPVLLTPYRICVTETLVREVVIYAEDAEAAQEMAEELCNDGSIDLDAEDFASRNTECRGEAQPVDFKLRQVFGKEEPAQSLGRPSLNDRILGAANRTSANGQSKQTEHVR